MLTFGIEKQLTKLVFTMARHLICIEEFALLRV